MPNGEEKPIAFASRTLNKAESHYAQIEREALGIVFGVRKFHQYLFGRNFTLLTDHRPLTTIFGPHVGIPSLAASRMQRWALLLSAHTYDIKYRKSELHANADAESHYSTITEKKGVTTAAFRSLWNCSHEGTCQELLLVARSRWTNRRNSLVVHIMPEGPQCATTGPTSPMGLARGTMAKSSHRFRWSIRGENVPCGR